MTTKRLFYINGLVEPTTLPNSQQNVNMITLDLSNTRDLENLVRRYAEHGKDDEHESRSIVIMDGLDFLLASRPAFTNLVLSRTIMTLRQYVHNIIVTSSADYPLLHNSSSSAAPLEGEHRAFVTTMAHQSRIVVQLRSLGTGAAKDISGVLRVSAGGAYDESKEDDAAFEEAEWLYQVRGDGSVRIWGRGE
jgi:elongator complex protein 6